MNVEQVIKAGLKIKEKGMVVTGSSLKEQLNYSDPRTLITVWLKNSPKKDVDPSFNLPTVQDIRSKFNENSRSESLYNKTVHDICEDSSEIIYHLENKIKKLEAEFVDINGKLYGAERELHQNKKTLDVLNSIINKLNDTQFVESKKITELKEIIEGELLSLNNKLNQGAIKEAKSQHPKKYLFSSLAMSNLSSSDQQLFEEFGQGPIESVPYSSLHKAFEAHAATSPNTIAAEHLGETITYQALNRQANQLAILLSKHGVKRGDNVALFLQRSIPMLVGILATLKLGAAYVPQHLGVAPESQLSHVIKAAGTKVILTLASLKHLVPIPEGHTCIAIDEVMEDELGSEVDTNPVVQIDNNDKCFILFTSGTTGNPNGVQVTHGNVCNIILTEPGNLGIKPGMKVAQILSIAFDMAAWEIFGCLTHGATLIIRGKNIQQAAEQADVVIATPSVLGSIDADKCHNVKVAAVAGEPCPKPLADKWASFCKFHNSCGPTETTIVNTVQHYTESSEQLTIGKPTPNNTVYVLDSNMQPCSMGEVGEMWAGGDCVTAGYLDNPKLNKERYAPDPFLGNGRMMFRTRDLGRWTANGELEHFGRVDDQVKIRGFRVELDSVSAVLEKVDHCSQAVTLKFDNRNLVAFVSPKTVDVEVARKAVANALPYYCTPAMIFALDELPRTNRGKVDKRALMKIALQQNEEQQTKEQQPVMMKETS